MGYSKADVQFHSDNGYNSQPAVNVKRWPDYEKDVDWAEYEAEFKEWALAELEKDDVWPVVFSVGCEIAWDNLQSDAEFIFESRTSRNVKVWSQGRSGGWAVVEGLKEFESWDAIDLAAWRKFERWAKSCAEAVAHYGIDFLYLNRWDAYRTGASADALAVLGS